MEGGNVNRINRLPWRYVKELHNYWIDEPPVHILVLRVARAFGLRAANTRKPEMNEVESYLAGMAERPTSVSAGMRSLTQLPPSVTSWIQEEMARNKNASN